MVAISAAISPYREIRDELRGRIENFIEVYTRCSIDELSRRDVKGLYAKALAGEIANFTGVSDPYEEPESPEIICDSEAETVEQSLDRIIRSLELMGFVPPGDEMDTSPEEEAAIRERLQALGYL